MMASHAPTYAAQREKLASYFDGTARKAWIDMTSDAQISRIRATVRAGREEMRGIFLDWLPDDLRRTRLLDAGCGTGLLSVDAARQGAHVIAVDVAGGLVSIARERADGFLGHGRIDWHVGDMADPQFGRFDHVVAMDSLIHYTAPDMVAALEGLAARCDTTLIFTFAPLTPLLGAMHRVGKLFPRANRSPAIVPVAEAELRERLARIRGWRVARTQRVSSGFYTSQAMELVREG